jgi:hypothetical protein
MIADSDLILPEDGRQSDTARMVARGTRRLLRDLGLTSVTEVPLASGRRADLVGLSENGMLFIVEIKSSIEDFRTDRKWPEYRTHCDRLYFAIPATVPVEIMPEEAGLILADGFGAAILREAPEHRLAAATRKAMLVRLARIASERLHRLADPDELR